MSSIKNKSPGNSWGIRHLQVMLLFLAITLGLCMRVNMSIAIVAMTDGSADGSFDWNIQTQSVILSSFFWGYVVLQVPGGELAARVGGKVLIALCIGCNAAVSVLIPVAAHHGGWKMVCACRVVQGLSQGFLLPGTHHLMSKWAPLNEKSRLTMFVYSGAQVGIALQLIVSGYIADRWGWPAIFYVNGVTGAVWTVLYVLIGADSPEGSNIISAEEKLYIQMSLGHVNEKKTKLPTPWLSIWTSPPFLSLILVHVCQAWTMWTLMTEIPSYMSKALGVNIKENGVLSAIPYVTMFVLSIPFGIASDYVVKHKYLSLTVTRKISNTISFYGPAAALLALWYYSSGIATAVALLSIAVGLNAGHITGFFLAHIDMAPNFAGTLMGITNGAANLVSIFAPLACGAILKDETDHAEWAKIFFLTAAFYIVGNTLYLIFGTSEKQKWNEPTTSDTQRDTKC